MLHSNPTFERGALPERAATPAPGQAPSHPGPTEEAETRVPVLGKTLLFRGELTAEEDVILQGRVEGSIRHARNLIIGTDGSVLGDVYASHLTVEGLVEGDLHCSEAVIVRATAQVRGNIYAPRVGIMEGATFNGRVEMDPNAATAQSGASAARPAGRTAAGGNRAAAPSASMPARAAGGPGGSRSAPPAAGGPQAPSSAAAPPLGNPGVDQLLTQGRK